MGYIEDRDHILNDSTTPYWMADLIRTADTKDAVESWAVVDMVADLLRKRMNEALASAMKETIKHPF